MKTEDYTYGRFNEGTVNEYGIGEKDERGYYSMRLFKFQLQPPEHIDMEDDDNGEKYKYKVKSILIMTVILIFIAV